MPKRKADEDSAAYNKRISSYFPSQRTATYVGGVRQTTPTTRPFSVRMQARQRRLIKRKKYGKRPAYRRRTFSRRRTIGKGRRIVRRRGAVRGTNTFSARVAKATSATCKLFVRNTTTLHGTTYGQSLIDAPTTFFASADISAVQARLQLINQGGYAPALGRLNFISMKGTKRVTTYLNASATKVWIDVWYIKCRLTSNSTPYGNYNQGLTRDTTMPALDPATTPYHSPDFVTNYIITRHVRRGLEQGERITVTDYGPIGIINPDKFDVSNQSVKGMRGHFTRFVGDYGVDSTGSLISTQVPKILANVETYYQFCQLADNVKFNAFNTGSQYPTVTVNTLKTANDDIGAAITGDSGTMVS